MPLSKAPHNPGEATALIPVVSGPAMHVLAYLFYILVPVKLSVTVILLSFCQELSGGHSLSLDSVDKIDHLNHLYQLGESI